MVIDEKSTACSVCGRSMYDAKTKISVVGLEIRIIGEPDAHPELRRVIETFGTADFGICYVCWLRALGVKPIRRHRPRRRRSKDGKMQGL